MRPSYSALLAIILGAPVFSQEIRFEAALTKPSPAVIRGAALSPDRGKLYTWGDGIHEWDVRTLQSRKLVDGWFGEGGCIFYQNGHPGLIVQKGDGLGDLVWLDSKTGKPNVMDTQVSMHDCLAVTLLGRRGVLMVQRGMQVRFYEAPRPGKSDWGYNEIYSFYTPSRQAALLMADIDGDGFPDILCGNYWIRSPERFDMPWRLYAINTYSETQDSATSRMALTEEANGVFVAQGELRDARFAWFDKPADLWKQLWTERRLESAFHLCFPRGLLALDLNGDGKKDAVLAEHNGTASRLFTALQRARGEFQIEQVAQGTDILVLFPLENGKILSVGPESVVIWNYSVQRRK